MRSWPTVVQSLRRLGRRPLLHIQYQSGAFDLQGAVNLLPAFIRRVVPDVRVVTTFHDFRVPYLFPKAGALRLHLNRLLARSSDAAIFTDEVDVHAAGLDGHAHLIPIGSNVDCVPPRDFDRGRRRRLFGADDATFLVGHFGFLNGSKGIPTLLHAVSALAAEGRDVRLAFIGAQRGTSNPIDQTYARDVHQLITALDLKQRVTLTGYLPPSDLSAALLSCDVIALPFEDGVSPRRGTLMAAITHGMPVVSTVPARGAALSHGKPFLLRDGVDVVLVPPRDPRALARALARLADDSALRARLGHNISALAPIIAWPHIARQTLDVYETVLDRRTTNDDRRRRS